jgi:hypothetical protein
MAQAISIHTTSRFFNLSDAALAEEIGHADALLKGAEAECKALKDEFKRRCLTEVVGDNFTITATEQIAGRLDTKAVKAFLGESYHRFENAVVSTVIRIKAVTPITAAIAKSEAARLSALISDPFVRASFERAEREDGCAPAISRKSPPTLNTGAAELEPRGEKELVCA